MDSRGVHGPTQNATIFPEREVLQRKPSRAVLQPPGSLSKAQPVDAEDSALGSDFSSALRGDPRPTQGQRDGRVVWWFHKDSLYCPAPCKGGQGPQLPPELGKCWGNYGGKQGCYQRGKTNGLERIYMGISECDGNSL